MLSKNLIKLRGDKAYQGTKTLWIFLSSTIDSWPVTKKIVLISLVIFSNFWLCLGEYYHPPPPFITIRSWQIALPTAGNCKNQLFLSWNFLINRLSYEWKWAKKDWIFFKGSQKNYFFISSLFFSCHLLSWDILSHGHQACKSVKIFGN